GLSAVVFFFQAEDGIRDATVTGVQTCALPISVRAVRARGRDPGDRPPTIARVQPGPSARRAPHLRLEGRPPLGADDAPCDERTRSEERRVGKEWRYRW